MNNVKKNFVYNIMYQLLILIIPLITAPYLSRVVGADGVGIYSYNYSIVYYFMLLTLLGVNNYGNRTVAKTRENKKELSKNFGGIYYFQLFMGILMLIIYICYALFLAKDNKIIVYIDTLFIFSAILDINWLFFGLEEFKKTITRNTILKVLNIILIFIFVKSKDDLWKYTVIMAGVTCISQLIMWNFARKKIEFSNVNLNDIKKHIKPNLILFIPVVAVSLYKMMDKIMLGTLSGVTEVGYYENAEKIISIPQSLITALGTVMLPRISNIMTKGDKNKVINYISKSTKFVMFMSFAMCFGLIIIGKEFAPFYFGNEFKKTGILIMLLATILPFLSFANVLRTQYLIPYEKDKIYIKSVSSGALVNLIINILLIPKYGSVGACIGTIFAELTVMFYQTLSVRKDIPVWKYICEGIPFFYKSLIMLLIAYPINDLKLGIVSKLFLQIIISVVIYGILNYKYIMSLINIKKIKEKLRKKELN